MHAEVKRCYDYHFQITRITIVNPGPDAVEVVEDNLDSMVEAIPLLESMPEIVDVSYHITVAYTPA